MRMRTTAQWMLASMAVSLAMVIVIRLSLGPRERMVNALQATARWSFALFWLATVGGPLRTLFGPKFKPLAQRARDLGLSYASAHLVHLGLVVWMFLVSEPDLSRQFVIFFGAGIFWTYLLAALSFGAVSGAVGARGTRLLRIIGVEYLTLLFFVDFNKNPFGGSPANIAYYAPFLTLTVAGPLLRLAALAKRQIYPSRLAAS
jgi:methionine sulfoxide reductase heme-binding subunit